MRQVIFLWIFLAAILFYGCRSQPLPLEEPPLSLALSFQGIEADDPANLRLLFDLESENQPTSGANARIVSWHVEVDGHDAGAAFSLDHPQGDFSLATPVPLRLDMDITALTAQGLAPKEEYDVTLIAELDFSPAVGQSNRIVVRGHAVFPGVRPPVFSITEIAILKAELINTRFRVGLQIDNPNPFPLELSAFNYSLYGNGMFWAGGVERNVLVVNGNSTLSGNLFLLMNFMGMNRRLLDQIILLEDVRYRFTGNVQVSTGIEHLPVFSDSFELSGFSQVLDR